METPLRTFYREVEGKKKKKNRKNLLNLSGTKIA